MTTKFTASNGISMGIDEYGCCNMGETSAHRYAEKVLTSREFHALEEFAQHRRDQELGRWRWPEDPNVVVIENRDNYRGDGRRWAAVYDEREMGKSSWYCSSDSDAGERGRERLHDAAHDYFAAHPEKKPWHDAEHEEVWEITANGDTGPALATTSNKRGHALAFQFANGTLIEADSDEITAGRRIWPTGADDE